MCVAETHDLPVARCDATARDPLGRGWYVTQPGLLANQPLRRARARKGLPWNL